ncbi:MAG: hypothetical protein QME12_05910 [Nanoarchaeota archaeon]|nr:hypothetical protein [Nanoarchaeota archaeon]
MAEKLSSISGKPVKMYIVNHGNNQQEIMKKTTSRYRCVLCKRLMFRIAEKIAVNEKADFIITGDNLGQVASQTLQNMAVIESVIKILVLRPVLCNDKVETIKIAKEIGTYDISIQASSCCGALPDNPVTKAKRDNVEREEGKL